MTRRSFFPLAGQSRRDFIKAALVAAGSISLWPCGSLDSSPKKPSPAKSDSPVAFKFRTLSVDHFPALQNDIDRLKRGGLLSRNPVFNSYIDNMKFQIPAAFRDARSVVILATPTPQMEANFHLDGQVQKVIIPPQYYDDGLTLEGLAQAVQKEVIREPGFRVKRASGLHLKLLAVRSGLGRYGRNNLCFVDGLGTYLTLYAFLTDYRFPEDHWGPLALLEECRTCVICYGICPTSAIVRDNFVIDVGKCITLYNEIDGRFPNWILPSMHNALMGCMKCQKACPVNAPALAHTGQLEDVTEEETRQILEGRADEALLRSLSRKLKSFSPTASKELFPIFTRNLSALIRPGRTAPRGGRGRDRIS